ncbi:MAG: hypothetical protein IJD98_04815 [Oscillospiraceae bacterium]|nr:hypothetical protein [Oscillospiraceae bacterium]
MSKNKITGKVLVIQLGRNESQFVLTDNDSHVLYGDTVPTPAGAVEDGMIWNAEAVQGMLKSALRTPELRGVRQAVFVLCTSQVISETITTPDLPANKLAKLLEANMDMYFPVDVAEYQMVWQPIGPKNEGGMKELLVQLWAVPNSILARYYSVANSCGLAVTAIDYCGNSIATAVGATFAKPIRGKAAKERKKLNLNQEISFGKKKKAEPELDMPEEARDLDAPVETDLHLLLDQDLLGLTFVQAGQVVFQRFLRCSADPAYQFGELAMMVEYFRSLEVGRNAELNCLVCGGLSTDGQLVLELADVLGMPLSLYETSYDPSWFLCVGAAHTSLDFGTPSLNRIVDSRKQVKSELWQYGLILAGGLAVLGVFMMLLTSRLSWNTQIQGLENTSQTLQLQAAGISNYAENYYEYENMYNAYSSDWDGIFARLRTNNDNLVLMLQEMEDMLPENAKVTSLEVTATGMNVSFACENKEEAAYLIMKLRELEYAKPVYISDLSGGGRGAAKHYGSGEASETPPVEGGSGINGDMNQVNQESFLEAVIFLPDDQLSTLQASEYVLTPPSSHSLAELKGISSDVTTRHAALEQMLKTNPFAMNSFKKLVVQDLKDLQAGADTVLVGYILFDLLPHQDKVQNPPENLTEMYEFIDILLDAVEGEDYKITAAEDLIGKDAALAAAYNHYLEVQMSLNTASKYPYLNTDKIALDGGFHTGNADLNGKLNALFPVIETPDDPTVPPTVPETEPSTEPTTPGTEPTTPSTEPGTEPTEPKEPIGDLNVSDEMLNSLVYGYVYKGTSGNPMIDGYLNKFIQNGTTGVSALDAKIEAYIKAGKMDPILEDVLQGYIYNSGTANTVINSMLLQYDLTGQIKNDVLGARIAICRKKVYSHLVNDLLAKVEANTNKQEQTGTATNKTPVDTRIHFAVVLEYKQELLREEQTRKNLDYSEKVAPLEVTAQ